MLYFTFHRDFVLRQELRASEIMSLNTFNEASLLQGKLFNGKLKETLFAPRNILFFWFIFLLLPVDINSKDSLASTQTPKCRYVWYFKFLLKSFFIYSNIRASRDMILRIYQANNCHFSFFLTITNIDTVKMSPNRTM